MSANRHSGWMRHIAALTLAVWLMGQFVCLQHCALANGVSAKAASARACCHKTSAPGDSKSSPSHTSPSVGCLSLKMLLSTPDAAISAPDQFDVLAVLLFVQTSVPDFKVASSDRQSRPPDCVITHEVSLGNAAHTLAPPFFS